VSIVVSVYFVIDSVRKLLDTPSYTLEEGPRRLRRTGTDRTLQPLVYTDDVKISDEIQTA
jgi:hypothetical protein